MADKNETKHLAADFIRVAERYYTSWPQLLIRSFVSGLMASLGATIGLALVLWLTSQIMIYLGVLPVIGDFFIQANDIIRTYTPGQ